MKVKVFVIILVMVMDAMVMSEPQFSVPKIFRYVTGKLADGAKCETACKNYCLNNGLAHTGSEVTGDRQCGCYCQKV